MNTTVEPTFVCEQVWESHGEMSVGANDYTIRKRLKERYGWAFGASKDTLFKSMNTIGR